LTGDIPVIISMTSFPARINTVWMTVDCLFRQTKSPSSVNLYLSSVEFPNREKDLPKRLLGYERLGLKIIFVEDNLRPHKKYYYAFNNQEKMSVVTVDDDLFYRNDIVERLWNLSMYSPDCICANNGRLICFNNNGEVSNYSQWNNIEGNRNKGHEVVAIGFGGVLYPVSFQNIMSTDVKVIKQICLNADDLWLKTNELLNNVYVLVDGYYPPPACIPNTSISALQNKNRLSGESGNDLQWKKLDEKFHINERLKKICYDQKN